jgi:ATP/maltotriose-dependent transcriptional regulator MalT/DNA-binding SARP family transcriptional activator
MEPKAVPVAAFKTTAPSLDGAIARPALVARLRAGAGAATWVCAPSGSGKSTLVATHVREAGRRVVWYRLDERDDDPAFFYPQFTGALRASLGGCEALPAFTDDDRADEARFAARYFDALLAEVTQPATLVLDDAHRLARAPMQSALAALALRAGGALDVLFIAEDAPGSPWFDAIAARRLVLCNDLSLAFDAAEAAALASAARVRHADGATLAALTGGHAGTLVVACELLRGDPDPSKLRETVDDVHHHLLDRLLAGMPAPRRELVQCTAFAPQFTAAMARELAGDAALAELDTLVARGLLRRIASDGEMLFEAHGLLRRGVQSLLARAIGEASRRDLALRTAGVLERHGWPDEAFALLIELGEADRAGALLEPLARAHAGRGEAQLLLRALDALPQGAVQARPWLCFWAGEALLGSDEEAARGWFEHAHAAFARAGDRAGTRLAASRVVTAFGLEYGDLRALDTWLARFDAAGGDAPITQGTDHEMALCLGTLCAAMIRGAHPPRIEPAQLTGRIRSRLDDAGAWLTPEEPVVAARLLIDHARIFGAPEQALSYIVDTRRHAEQPHVGPLQRGRWHVAAASIFYMEGAHAPADDHLAQARVLAERSGSRRLAFELGMAEVDALLRRNDFARASAALAALEMIARDAPPAQRAEHARITARTRLMQGHAAEGLRWAEQALEVAQLAGYSGPHARLFHLEHLYALVATERYADARAAADRLVAHLEERQRAVIEVVRDCVACLSVPAACTPLLADALARAESLGFVNLLARAPAQLTRLCHRALTEGIRTDFVRKLIAVQRLEPPAGAGPEWPYPVKVRTLGGFELEIAGARYRPAHKTQDKPLELLKLLVTCQALGRRSAQREWVAERLWPDADEPNARKSLDMALSRLRKLLGDDEAVLLSEGRLMLSAQRVWTDLDPLLRALAHAGAQRDAHAAGRPGATHATALDDVAAVLRHYGGRFLPEEGDLPWLMAGREAVAAAVRTALMIADTVLAGRSDAALIPALERAFAADPTSEDLARALMSALARENRPAEAIGVYRRLREILSVVMSMPPSAATEHVRQSLHAAAQAGSAGGGTAAGAGRPTRA